MRIRASVVVPTHHRPAHLERCLHSLLAQDLPGGAFEVIVVDDAHCDETQQLIHCLAERVACTGHKLRYLRTGGQRGPAASRNEGWCAAQGEVVAFTDDDCIPCPGWLRLGLSAFVERVEGASGRILVPLDGVPSDYELNVARLEGSEFVTANCFYRREALHRIGGFDERFRLAWREDTDVHFTLIGEGASLVKVPEAIVVHPVRPARWAVSLGQQRKSMFNALLYKKHPALYRERVQATPPWGYYATVLLLLTTLRNLRRRKSALLPAVLWALLTARFCCARLRSTSHAPGHVAEMVVTSCLIPPLSVFWRLAGAVRFRVLFL